MREVVWFRFQQFLDALPCCLWKGPVKGKFLNIYFARYFRVKFLNMYFARYFGVRNFGNMPAMMVIFLLKIFKI